MTDSKKFIGDFLSMCSFGKPLYISTMMDLIDLYKIHTKEDVEEIIREFLVAEKEELKYIEDKYREEETPFATIMDAETDLGPVLDNEHFNIKMYLDKVLKIRARYDNFKIFISVAINEIQEKEKQDG